MEARAANALGTSAPGAVAVWLAGCGATHSALATPVVTRAEYEQLSRGMAYAQVSRIVGDAGTVGYGYNVGGVKTRVFWWENSDGSMRIAHFRSYRLINRTSVNLP